MAVSSISDNYPSFDKVNTTLGALEMHFIGHGSLMFIINNYVIHIDPVRSSGNYNSLPGADLIIVTHEHYDHLDPGLIDDLRKPETLLISNRQGASQVQWARVMKPGDTEIVNNIIIEAVPAYNIVHMSSPGRPFHPQGVGNGYILTIGDKRIYIAGDTENIPEMKELKDIDIAFLPMNLPYTMTPEMVADAALGFKPKILYPYHFGDTDTDKIIKLLSDSDIKVIIRSLK
jgi:L-ascorbate metabolism protein UlaG (beta-lactamase superfamily)